MEPKEIFDEKIKFFNESESTLTTISRRIQDIIWRAILPILDLFDENIIPDDATIRMIYKLENEAFRTYKDETIRIAEQTTKDFGKINKINDKYFGSYKDQNLKGFLSGVSYSEAMMRERLGLAPNGLSAEGFLSGFINNPEVLQSIKEVTFSALTTGTSKESLTTRMNDLIQGTKETTGISEAQVNRYINDAYNNFDSLTQSARADRMGMKVAIYSNSIVQDSRCFCRNRFNRAWTVNEISKWTASTKSSQTRSGKGCKAIYWTTRYDPFVHRGGFNCRHVYRYVPKSTAIRFRPELKEYYEQLEEDGVEFI